MSNSNKRNHPAKNPLPFLPPSTTDNATNNRLRPCPAFLQNPHLMPANYVAGVGRGATAFITRPDLGDIDTYDSVAVPIKGINILGWQNKSVDGRGEDVDDDSKWIKKHEALNAKIQAKFSIPNGNGQDEREDKSSDEEGILGRGINWDKDDDAADAIYDNISDRMSSKRGKRNGSNDDDTSNLFAPLKRDLISVTEEQWMSLPEAADHTKKRLNKKGMMNSRKERYTPVPDNLLLGGNLQDATDKTVTNGGFDFRQISRDKERVLGNRLDSIKTNINEVERDELEPMISSVDPAELSRARQVYQSILGTDVKVYLAWSALELRAGYRSKAIQILRDGISKLSGEADLWIALVELDNTLVNLQNAVKTCPNVPELWIGLSRKQRIHSDRVKTLKKAIEHNPKSVDLWTELLLAEGEDANDELLDMAIEHTGHATFILKRHYNNIEELLRVRTDDLDLWIRCLQLDVRRTLPLFLEKDYKHINLLDIARKCVEYPETCMELINHSNLVQLSNMVHGDVSNLPFNKMVMTRLLREGPCNADLWIKAVRMEGSGEEQIAILKRGLAHCNNVVLWTEYLSLTPDDDKEALYKQAREGCKEMVIPYAQHLAACGKEEQAIQTLDTFLKETEGDVVLREKIIAMLCRLDHSRCIDYLKTYPKNELIWSEACKADDSLYQKAVKACPTSSTLWVSYARNSNNVAKARAILEQARLCNKTNPDIWIASLDFEHSQPSTNTAVTDNKNITILLSRAPNNIDIWRWRLKEAMDRRAGEVEIKGLRKMAQDAGHNDI